MRRWGIGLALLVSLGVNVGLLGALATGRWTEREATVDVSPGDAPPPAVASGGRELPTGVAIDVPDEPEPPAPDPPADEPRGDLRPASEPAGAGSPPPPSATAEPSPPGASRPPSAGPGERPPSRLRPGGDHPPHRRPHARLGHRHLDRHAAEHGAGGPPLGRLADHLGLEGERRERFLDLQRRFLDAHLDGHRERAGLSAALRDELLAADPDRARVDDLLARLAASRAAGERATADVLLESRALLDADQQRRYLRFLERLSEGHGPHRPHRPPP